LAIGARCPYCRCGSGRSWPSRWTLRAVIRLPASGSGLSDACANNMFIPRTEDLPLARSAPQGRLRRRLLTLSRQPDGGPAAMGNGENGNPCCEPFPPGSVRMGSVAVRWCDCPEGIMKPELSVPQTSRSPRRRLQIRTESFWLESTAS
jgi:hypothetical protein